MKTMHAVKLVFSLCCFMTSANAMQGKTHPATVNIDQYIKHLMQRHGIPGISLAVVKDDQVIYQKNHGLANLEHQVPVKDQSIFRVYSLTKLIVVTTVFQLVEQHKLSLQDPVAKYLSDLPPDWTNIRIVNLITHSSGLPDMAPFMEFQELTEAQATAVVFAKPLSTGLGETYDYNQTNYWLLRRIIEKVSATTLDELIATSQFNGEQETVFLSGDSRDIVVNRVTPYFPFRTGKMNIDHSYQQGKFLDAANALNLTLQQFIQWDRRLRHNELLTEQSKKTMWQLFNYSQSDKTFTHGWDQHNINGHVSYGFTGSLVTAYRTFPQQNMSIVLLSNGLKTYYNIDNSVNYLAGLVNAELMDPNNQVYEGLLQAALEQPAGGLVRTYHSYAKNNDYQAVDLESQLNSVGYSLLNLGKNKLAIEVLAFNVEQYPDSWNVYDSLAEAYEISQQFPLAIKYYSQALTLSSQVSNKHKDRLNQKIAALKAK